MSANPSDFEFSENEETGGGTSKEERVLEYTPEERATMEKEKEGGGRSRSRTRSGSRGRGAKEERARGRAAEKRMENKFEEMKWQLKRMQEKLEKKEDDKRRKNRRRRISGSSSGSSRSRSRSMRRSTSRRKIRSRSSSRKGKKSGRSKSSSTSVSPVTKARRIEKRMKRLGKEEWEKLGKGNKKQLEFIEKVEERLEDIEVRVDKHFKATGGIPRDVKKMVEKGKKQLSERSEDIWRADKYGWKVSERYRGDSLCKSDKDERRQNRVRKDVKDEEEDYRKKRMNKSRGRGGGIMGASGAWARDRPYRGFGGGAYGRDDRYRGGKWKQVNGKPLFLPGRGTLDRRQGKAVSSAEMNHTGRASVREMATGGAGPVLEGGQGEAGLEGGAGRVLSSMNCKAEIKEASDRAWAEKKLDQLENVLVREEESEEAILFFEEDENIEYLLSGTLRSHLSFWKETGASQFALGVIENGYIPKMKGVPPIYVEKNNASYWKHRGWANEAVDRLATLDIAEKVSRDQLHCQNPMSVAVNAEGKKRLVIDLSRCFNEEVHALKFKIESTWAALQMVEKGDWMFAFDLKGAYHHIPMHQDYYKFLGFSIQRDNGQVEYFRYKMLPFGLNDAARVLTKLMRGPIERWRRMEIPIFIHLDDGLGLCKSRQGALEASEQVRSDLKSYGLLVSEGKCSWGARRKLTWTGFEWDTEKFELTIPAKKIERALVKVEQLWNKRGKGVKVREMASVAGLIGSFNLAMGDVTKFHTRSLLLKVAEVVDAFGWEGWGFVGERGESELRFWMRNMRGLNGHRMRKEDKVWHVNTVEMFSDAGEYFLGGAEFEGLERVRDSEFKAYLDEGEQGKSSTYRELRGIEEGLKARGETLRGCLVRWGCDNFAAGQIVRLGSMKAECHEVALRIWDLVKRFELVLETFWVSRDSVQVQFCDDLSKDFDTSDYRLCQADFACLEARFGPFSVDFFASDFTFRLKPFFAKLDSAQAAGVNAFSVDWGKWGSAFFHPPVGLIMQVLRYAEKCEAKGLLVVPNWQGSAFAVKIRGLEKGGKLMLVDKFRPFLETPGWLESRTFKGVPKFDFLVYRLQF